MKRASSLLVSIVIAASTLGASVQAAAAYNAHVWSNSDAFAATCLGFTDTYPKQHYSLTVSQFSKLGYSPVSGALGAGFTRSAFLGNVFYDYAVYVHSHGDNYLAVSGAPNVDSAFLQDPGSGKCNTSKDMVRSSAIKTATASPATMRPSQERTPSNTAMPPNTHNTLAAPTAKYTFSRVVSSSNSVAASA